jgi:hypothetical protein
MRKLFATLAIVVLGAIGAIGPASSAVARSAAFATASCVNASTPGGTKCLQAGEFCSHKPGYAAAYRRAGFKCKSDGRLGYA